MDCTSLTSALAPVALPSPLPNNFRARELSQPIFPPRLSPSPSAMQHATRPRIAFSSENPICCIALGDGESRGGNIGCDNSAAALAVAKRNAARHEAADRIQFRESNLLDGLTIGARYIVPLQPNLAADDRHESPVASHESRSFDLIVSNPPYIGRSEKETLQREVRNHEPEEIGRA